MITIRKKKSKSLKSSPRALAKMLIAVLILGLIGSAIAQEGQIIKEIQIKNKIQDKEVLYKFPEPILLYPGNEIKLHCVVIPTLDYDIKEAYLNIVRKDGGAREQKFPLKAIDNKTIDQMISWTLSDRDKEGVYVASIDIVTTNINVPDAGAYVSLNLVPAGEPIIIKFEDINRNGKFDSGTEKTLRGWEFKVVDPQGGEKVLTTPDNGTIRLNPAAVGDVYSIIEDPDNKASTWQSTPPKEVKNGKYEVLEGQRELYYANNLKPASLLIIKFEDRNGNREYDRGEELANRDFTVKSFSGLEFTRSVRTNSSGIAYVDGIPFKSATGLPDDNPVQKYTVTESTRTGWEPIQSMVKELHPGEPGRMIIQNVLLGGNITVRKYEDINANRKYDPGEGCSGWAFTLTGPNVNLRSVTNYRGIASFSVGFLSNPRSPDELPRNTYVLHEEPRDGWVKVKDQNIVLSPNQAKTVDIANSPEPGTITVRKFEDANHNGRADAGEERSGWTFSVKGSGVRTPTATTNADGVATFTVDFSSDPGNPCQPMARSFIIHEVPKDGFAEQPDQQVEIGPGEETEATFLNKIPDVVLEIQKFYDANKNGVRDNGEDDGRKYPLNNWKFDVTYQGATKQYSTNADGKVKITLAGVLPEAACTVKEVLDDRPGWICTTANPKSIKVSSRNPYQTVEFGNRVNRLTIVKFDDANLNGKLDAGEKGLSGWTFNIEGLDGKSIASKATNADGLAFLEGIAPGKYRIAEVLQNGWINTTPLAVTVDVKGGEDITVPPFGNVRSSRIHVFKFNDTNRNGIRDTGENGLPGWNFSLETPDGRAISTAYTNVDGIAAFDGLTKGDYIVSEEVKDGWLNTTPCIVSVRLGLGASWNLSFGNYYCLRCHRINDQPKTDINSGPDITVIKRVSNISVQEMDRENGNPVDYNITICPTRGLGNIAAVPTDIVIAVDNSPSILYHNKSAIAGVQKLAKDIAANDKQNVTRIGLVSWSDREHSKIELPLRNDYASIVSEASRIRFAEGKQTDYEIGMDTALSAFQSVDTAAGRDKKIVIITDASDSGTLGLKNAEDSRYRDYTIFAIIVGNRKDTNATRMLDALTQKHNGYVISMQDLSDLEAALVRMATAGAKMRNVHLVEVLPSYMVLLNSTATDDKGSVHINRDGPDWSTTTVSWNIGDLYRCWSTDFQAVFCWKLPADVNQKARVSYINYTDEKGTEKTLILPEHEINIVQSIPAAGSVASTAATGEQGKNTPESPGFESLFAAIGLSMAGYVYRRRIN